MNINNKAFQTPYFRWRQIKTAVLSELNPQLLLAETSKTHPKGCALLWAPFAPLQLAPTLTLFFFSPSPHPPPTLFFLFFACLIHFYPPQHRRIQRLIQYTCSIWSNLVNLNIPVKCNFKVSLATSTKSRPIHQGFN